MKAVPAVTVLLAVTKAVKAPADEQRRMLNRSSDCDFRRKWTAFSHAFAFFGNTEFSDFTRSVVRLLYLDALLAAHTPTSLPFRHLLPISPPFTRLTPAAPCCSIVPTAAPR